MAVDVHKPVNLTGRMVDGSTVTARQNAKATGLFNALNSQAGALGALREFSRRLSTGGMLYKMTGERTDKVGLAIAAQEVLLQLKESGKGGDSRVLDEVFRNLWKVYGADGADKIAKLFGGEDKREGRIAALHYMLENSPNHWSVASLLDVTLHAHDEIRNPKQEDVLTFEQRERVLGMVSEKAGTIGTDPHFVQRDVADLYVEWAGKVKDEGRRAEAIELYQKAIAALNQVERSLGAGRQGEKDWTSFVNLEKEKVVGAFVKSAEATMEQANAAAEAGMSALEAGIKALEAGDKHAGGEKPNAAKAEAEYKKAREELPKADKAFAEAVGLYAEAMEDYSAAAELAKAAGQDAKKLMAKVGLARMKKSSHAKIEVPKAPTPKTTVNPGSEQPGA
ncbi:hypothetical protein DRN67_00080 [Candidatus Micrarchaeota archaeon]|nr:MAG: hypothetical protein DRN67_00080 [Candidatus Micrarchaeota archaeon]